MIISNPNKILRKKSENIDIKEIYSRKIQDVIKEMKRELVLSKENDGVALAAPQVGYNLRIFIIFEELIDLSKGKAVLEDESGSGKKKEDKFVVFINPEIIKKSTKKNLMPEGCLSVIGTQGKVRRAEKITVRAHDEKGYEFQMSGKKILSQAIEHEIDHLDGVLFIDKAEGLEKIKS